MSGPDPVDEPASLGFIQPPSTFKLVLLLALAVGAVATASLWIRLALGVAGIEGVGISVVIASGRMAIAALVVSPGWGRLYRQGVGAGWGYSVGAGFCLALHFATWITSLSYTSMLASTALVTTNPIWVALLEWRIQGQRPGRWTMVGLGLAIAGTLVLNGLNPLEFKPLDFKPLDLRSLDFNPPEGAELNLQTIPSTLKPLLGNSLALGGAIAASGYLLLGQRAQQQGLSTRDHTLLAYSTAALALLPLPLLLGTAYGGYPLPFYGYLLGLALIPQVIGHTLFNWAVRWISPTRVVLVLLGEPLGAALLGYWVFGESPGRGTGWGAAAIVLGVAIGCRPTAQKPR